MTRPATALERFHLALGVAGGATVAYAVAALAATSGLGGFVVLAMAGGAALAVVLFLVNRRMPPPIAAPDPFARGGFSTDTLNFAHVRVAGVGGLGLLVLCVVITWQFPLISTATAAGIVGGAVGGLVLIVHRRFHHHEFHLVDGSHPPV